MAAAQWEAVHSRPMAKLIGIDRSLQRINTLHPKLANSAARVVNQCIMEGIPIYIVWGHRSFDQQEVLFRHGRSIPGPVLTRNRPGFSPHNYGLALDFCLTLGQDLIGWDQIFHRNKLRAMWFQVIKMFEAEGWDSKWRGSAFEPGHVENLLGKPIRHYYEQAQEYKDRGYWNAVL